jgi:hypothetical protein
MESAATSGNDAGGRSEKDPLDQAGGGEVSKKGPYALHGLFSRSPWKALAKAGEDMKKLSITERMLHEHFKPKDAFQEFILDRAWSCVLRCVLIGREEERIFATAGKPSEDRLKDVAVLANYGGSKVVAQQTSTGLLNELNSMLRYDAYYAREFARWIGVLEELQSAGGQGPVFARPKKGENA